MHTNHTQRILFRTAGSMLAVMIALLSSSEISAQGRIILNGGKINITNGAVVVIGNSNPNALTRNSGHIISEGANNRIRWNIGTVTGSYTIPWGDATNAYIPVSFSLTGAAGAGSIYFSTLPTAAQNSASLPAGVANFNGANGEDISLVATDRFWKIDPQGYTANPVFSTLRFTYLDAEFAAPNKTTVENKLTALRWNNGASSWTDYTTGGIVNTTANTVTISAITAANFNPWWTVAYPGGAFHWVATGSSLLSSVTNWSLSAGGIGGAGMPSSGDVVYFDANRNGDCTLDADLDVLSMQVASGFSGTILPGIRTIRVANDAAFSGGTFSGGSGDMTIGGSLTVSGTAFTATSGILDVKQDFILTSGTFSPNGGTMRFSGTTGTQHITSSLTPAFANLDVTNTAVTGLINESNATMSGVLSLAANVIVDADGQSNNKSFTLLSTGDNPTQDGAIGILPAGAKVDGNVTVRRYMAIEGASAGRIYRYISSPVTAATVADLQNEIPVSGPFTGRSSCPGCGTTASMFVYDESIITDNSGDGIVNQNDGYVNFPKTSNSELLQPGRGYAVFVRGNILSSALWDVKGIINAGNVTPVSLPVSYTSSGVAANDGWNLVGNPFPATLDWNASSGWTKTNLNAAIYIRDNGTTAGQYATWNGVVGTNGGSRYIATGQAFWVKATAAAPLLRAAENAKAPGTSSVFFREQAPVKVLRIALKQGAVSDEAIVHFREDATPAFDSDADALKLPNSTFNLSTLVNGKEKLAINSLPAMDCSTNVTIAVDDAAKGEYTLAFGSLESFPVSTTLILTDNFTGNSIEIRNANAYPFSVTADPRSYGSTRFSLGVSWPEKAPAFSLTAPAVCEGSNAKIVVGNVQDGFDYTAWADDVPLSVLSASGNDRTFLVPHEMLTSSQSSIKVRATPQGCGLPVEKITTLDVSAKPVLLSVAGNFACREGAVLLSASGGKPNQVYRWYGEASATPLSESADSVFTTPVLTRSATYFVSLANALGCESARMPAEARVIQYEDPTITLENDSLASNYADGLEWFLNGESLSLQGSKIFPKVPGHYTVSVNVQGCIAGAEYIYRTQVVTGAEENNLLVLDVYPNPVIGDLMITTSAAAADVQEADIYDMHGQVIGSVTIREVDGKTAGTYSMKGKPPGVYVLKMVTSSWKRSIRIVKE